MPSWNSTPPFSTGLPRTGMSWLRGMPSNGSCGGRTAGKIRPRTRGSPTSSIEAIPKYIEYGLLARDPDGTVVPDIPVLKNTEYNDLYERICRGETVSRIDRAVGEDFRAFVSARAAILPPHLKSVPESLRLHEASSFAALAVLREAHRRGLFLKDAPDPCPPVVFAWME